MGDRSITDLNGRTFAYDQIIGAMKGNPFDMTTNRADMEHLSDALWQGIDSHLEAAFVNDRGDSSSFPMMGTAVLDGHTVSIPVRTPPLRSLHGVKWEFSPESLCVLIRRLLESEEYDAKFLGQDILDVVVRDGNAVHVDKCPACGEGLAVGVKICPDCGQNVNG